MNSRFTNSKLLKSIASDFLALLFCFAPMLVSLSVTAFILNTVQSIFVILILSPFVLTVTFIAVIFVFRWALPPLKKGVFSVGPNLGFMTWWAHSLLTRSARVFGIHYLLHSLTLFRWMYWRALGAKISYTVSTSIKITLHDLPLLEIHEGVLLAEDVEISGHLVRGDRILIAPVRIGRDTFIGRGTYIGPRTRIGNGCWIGMQNNLIGKVIDDGARVENRISE